MKVSVSASAMVAVLLGFVVLLSFVGQLYSALSVTVNDAECVYEFIFFAGNTISSNFVVVDHHVFWNSDHPGIDLIVTSPGGNVVHSSKGTFEDKFQLMSPSNRMYKFCFHNSHSALKTVSFYIHVGHISSENDIAKDEHLDPINVKIAELREALESVPAEQKYLLARDTITVIVRMVHQMQISASSQNTNSKSLAVRKSLALEEVEWFLLKQVVDK
ncbi:hypothetical protein ACSBR2_012235 [Camellia fascicularis]